MSRDFWEEGVQRDILSWMVRCLAAYSACCYSTRDRPIAVSVLATNSEE